MNSMAYNFILLWLYFAFILEPCYVFTHGPQAGFINQHIETETKRPPFGSRYFHMHFPEWKWLNFDQNFIEVCSQGSSWQYASIGLDNGLAPDRRQAIVNTESINFTYTVFILADISKTVYTPP